MDISTGEFATTQIQNDDILVTLRAELERLAVAELLVAEDWQVPPGFPDNITTIPQWYFEPGRAKEAIKARFNVSSLDGLGIRDLPWAMRASGALIKYLQDTQKGMDSTQLSFSTYSLSDFMVLDAETRRNLELTETLRDQKLEGSLLGVLDKTQTSGGKRMLRSWVNKPLLSLDAINKRLDLVEFFFNNGVLRQDLNAILTKLHDLERLVNRVNSGTARPPDLVALREDFQALPHIIALLKDKHPVLDEILEKVSPFDQERERLEAAIEDEPPATLANIGIIRPAFRKRWIKLSTRPNTPVNG